MIISRLTLFNFGVYAGENTFEFHGEKPVVLIGGMNGRGKTTFLDAVLLALYGPNSFAFIESRYQSYGRYLKSFVNRADGTLNTYVELEFKLDAQNNESYIVRRQWPGSGQRIREKICVYRNGEENKFLTDNWTMFVENILPSGLSSFFFFDGEKIAELALESTNVQMKESIRNLLGISVLDMLENDLGRIVSRIVRRSGSVRDAGELETLKERKKQADAALQSLDGHMADLSSRLEDTRKSLEKARSYYKSHGGDIVAQRQDLFNRRAYLSTSIAQNQERLVNLAGGELPLVLVSDLLGKIQKQAEKERDSMVLDCAVKKMRSMFARYSMDRTAAVPDSSVDRFISYMEEQAEIGKTASLYNLPDQALYQLNSLLSHTLSDSRQHARKEMLDRRRNQEAVDEIDSYLSVDIDEKSLAETYKKVRILEREIIDITTEMEAEKRRRVAVHGEAIRANLEYGRSVEKFLSNLELNDDGDRLLKYAHQAVSVLQEYRIRLQKQKIGVLAGTMTQCYKKLANKKNLIERIEIDNVTLDFSYIDYGGEVIPNSSLSAGERQLMVIALLWALAICSKRELPIIIDTPLSRMDSNHRVSLITTYFPQASKQTIILSTDSEIDRHYYEIMKEDVGDEFTLVYDDINRCSTIKRGYFAGNANGDQTD